MAKSYTKKYKLILPEGSDYYTIKDANMNAAKIDDILSKIDTKVIEVDNNITDNIKTELDSVKEFVDKNKNDIAALNTLVVKNSNSIDGIKEELKTKVNNDEFISYKDDMNSKHIEINDKITDLNEDLNTEISNRIDADNKINDKIGNMDDLTTTEKGTLVGSINELDSDVGPTSELKTESKNLSAAINEVLDKINSNNQYTNDLENNVNNAIDKLDKKFPNMLLIDKNPDTISNYLSNFGDDTDICRLNIRLKNILMLYNGRCVLVNVNKTISIADMNDASTMNDELTLYLGGVGTSLDLDIGFNKDYLTEPQAMFKYHFNYDTENNTITGLYISHIEWVGDNVLPYFDDSSNVTYWLGVFGMIKNKLTLRDIGFDHELELIDEKINNKVSIDDFNEYKDNVDAKFDDVISKHESDMWDINHYINDIDNKYENYITVINDNDIIPIPVKDDPTRISSLIYKQEVGDALEGSITIDLKSHTNIYTYANKPVPTDSISIYENPDDPTYARTFTKNLSSYNVGESCGHIWLYNNMNSYTLRYTSDSSEKDLREEGYVYLGLIKIIQDQEDNKYYLCLACNGYNNEGYSGEENEPYDPTKDSQIIKLKSVELLDKIVSRLSDTIIANIIEAADIYGVNLTLKDTDDDTTATLVKSDIDIIHGISEKVDNINSACLKVVTGTYIGTCKLTTNINTCGPHSQDITVEGNFNKIISIMVRSLGESDNWYEGNRINTDSHKWEDTGGAIHINGGTAFIDMPLYEHVSDSLYYPGTYKLLEIKNDKQFTATSYIHYIEYGNATLHMEGLNKLNVTYQYIAFVI